MTPIYATSEACSYLRVIDLDDAQNAGIIDDDGNLDNGDYDLYAPSRFASATHAYSVLATPWTAQTDYNHRVAVKVIALLDLDRDCDAVYYQPIARSLGDDEALVYRPSEWIAETADTDSPAVDHDLPSMPRIVRYGGRFERIALGEDRGNWGVDIAEHLGLCGELTQACLIIDALSTFREIANVLDLDVEASDWEPMMINDIDDGVNADLAGLAEAVRITYGETAGRDQRLAFGLEVA